MKGEKEGDEEEEEEEQERGESPTKFIIISFAGVSA